MKTIAALSLAILATTALTVPSFADDDDDGGRRYRPRQSTEWMSVDQLSSRLGELGYTAIREIESDDGRYEVEARSPEGRRVELRVNPVSGKVLRSKRDDDDDDDDDGWDD